MTIYIEMNYNIIVIGTTQQALNYHHTWSYGWMDVNYKIKKKYLKRYSSLHVNQLYHIHGAPAGDDEGEGLLFVSIGQGMGHDGHLQIVEEEEGGGGAG